MNSQIKELFKMDGQVDKKTATTTQIIGWLLLIFMWWFVSTMGWVNNRILPNPVNVIKSYGEMINDPNYNLLYNTGYSISINLLGYFEAILISIPLGFIIGLFPICRSLMSKQIDSIRFLPLPAATGIFISLFGIYYGVKVHFLAFGISVYLIPVIVQRIDELDKIYKQTIWTLGANRWQQIRYLYLPSVLSRVSDDIRVLVAISWTYVVVAELINNQGGLGGLTYIVQKASRSDMLYALLMEIIFIGYLSDKLFKGIDWLSFKFKYV
jgi:NitT/TauT family transport system permease protein